MHLDEPGVPFTQYVTLQQAAFRAGVSERTLMRMVKRKEFPAGYKVKGKWRWPVWELERFYEVKNPRKPSILERFLQWMRI